MEEDFGNGMPQDWIATGLWHVTNECSPAGDCQSEQWAYYGQFQPNHWPPCNAETPPNPNSGELRTSVIVVPEVPHGGSVVASFCHNVAMGPGSPGTHGLATFGVVDGMTHQFLFDVPTWQVYSSDLTQYAGQSIQLRWHYQTSNLFSLTNYGWQVDRITLSVDTLECEDVELCPGDLNSDGIVDGHDLLGLLSSWGSCFNCPADLNGDGSVDGVDLLALLSNWGPCE
jgi:hypothetical protein